MNKKETDSEFSLIEKITSGFQDFHGLKKGIGDDAAVIPMEGGKYQLISADTLVENDHFNFAWSSPLQVGMKAVEVNVSDIAAMGGTPTFILVSIVLNSKTPTKNLEEVYCGIQVKCEKYGISLIGGDTTHGESFVISVTILGEVSRDNLLLRSGAKAGDLLCVTGKLGASSAGYFSLKKGVSVKDLSSSIKKKHLTPESRLEAARLISPYASSMIDISDGLASEAKHLAVSSQTGVVVNQNQIPVSEEVLLIEKQLGFNPYFFALSGGEDFELLFSIGPENMKKIEKNFRDFTVVGEMTDKVGSFLLLQENKKTIPLPRGWDHLLDF